MITRVVWIAAVWCVVSAFGTAVPAAPADGNSSGSEVTPEAVRAIEKALAFLAKQQGHQGYFSGSTPVASTSMSCLAFMANGDTLQRGKYSQNIRKGLEYILRSSAKSGFISENATSGASGMHGHGFATLFLAELLGTIQDAELSDRVKMTLQRSVRLIEQSQNRFGGWNSSPDGNQSDDGSGAVAIMQITALRAARNAGMRVDEKVIEKSKKYLLEMTTSDGWYQYNYNSRGGHHSSALTGAGMYMLGALDLYKDPKYEKGIKNLMANAPFLGKASGGDQGWQGWYHYTCFYASLAIFQYGGENWKKWYPAMRDELIRQQASSGGWEGGYGGGSYGGLFTAFGVLSMQMPYRYLPIFQSGGRGAEGF